MKRPQRPERPTKDSKKNIFNERFQMGPGTVADRDGDGIPYEKEMHPLSKAKRPRRALRPKVYKMDRPQIN